MKDFNLGPPKIEAQRCKIVWWTKTPCGWMKLNCDGSAQCNPRSLRGGSLLRDTNGNFKGAFTSYYEIWTNNKVELKGYFWWHSGLQKIILFNVIIESESKIFVDWFTIGKCTLWYLWEFWEECIKEMQMMNVRIIHQLRDGNLVADFLAKLGEVEIMNFMKMFTDYQN